MQRANDTDMMNWLKHRSLGKLVYPSISLLYAATVLIIFVFVARYLSGALNSVFATDPSESRFSIHRDEYAIVAGKLGLPPLASDAALMPDTSETASSSEEMAPTTEEEGAGEDVL